MASIQHCETVYFGKHHKQILEFPHTTATRVFWVRRLRIVMIILLRIIVVLSELLCVLQVQKLSHREILCRES